jgi:ABC-type amino acid transport substrate-binding protein
MGRSVEAGGDRRNLGLCEDRRGGVTKLLAAVATTVLVFLASGRTDPRADETNEAALRVCLNENLPPFSVRTNQGGVGFDVLVAQALAERLRRRLAVQWYESKLDEDSNTAIEANALLSDGRCDLVAGFLLMKDALGKPGLETASMPDFAGANPADRRRRVTLGTLTATTPYCFAGFAVVLGANAKDRRIRSLADLDDLNLTAASFRGSRTRRRGAASFFPASKAARPTPRSFPFIASTRIGSNARIRNSLVRHFLPVGFNWAS